MDNSFKHFYTFFSTKYSLLNTSNHNSYFHTYIHILLNQTINISYHIMDSQHNKLQTLLYTHHPQPKYQINNISYHRPYFQTSRQPPQRKYISHHWPFFHTRAQNQDLLKQNTKLPTFNTTYHSSSHSSTSYSAKYIMSQTLLPNLFRSSSTKIPNY